MFRVRARSISFRAHGDPKPAVLFESRKSSPCAGSCPGVPATARIVAEVLIGSFQEREGEPRSARQSRGVGFQIQKARPWLVAPARELPTRRSTPYLRASHLCTAHAGIRRRE